MNEEYKEQREALHEAEVIANTPIEITQLHPHERMLIDSISMTASAARLTDRELMLGLERIIRYLNYHLSQRTKKGEQK